MERKTRTMSTSTTALNTAVRIRNIPETVAPTYPPICWNAAICA